MGIKVILPRIVVAGMHGGVGKTLVSIGLVRAFVRRGLRVQVYKKGPDYIDAAWLSLAAGRAAATVDPFMMDTAALYASFIAAGKDADLLLVEGNRGLYDGFDAAGSYSTATVAKMLEAPVLLVMSGEKMTRTAAALVLGCLVFDTAVQLAGVLVNKVGGARHQARIKQYIEELAALPVFGVLPRSADHTLTERRDGLVNPALAPEKAEALVNGLADFIEAHVDVPALLALARAAKPMTMSAPETVRSLDAACSGTKVRIGVVQDAGTWFYYSENLRALEQAGAELVPLSLLNRQAWPVVDALYVGGGQPHNFAAQMLANGGIERLRLTASAVPIYAEGAGACLLGQVLSVDGQEFPMAGMLPYTSVHCAKPLCLGYVSAQVRQETVFHPKGTVLRGHEYHYLRFMLAAQTDTANFSLCLSTGKGMSGSGLDGYRQGMIFASSMQIFAPSATHWAQSFVHLARTQ